jgi:hypothetical protein
VVDDVGHRVSQLFGNIEELENNGKTCFFGME